MQAIDKGLIGLNDPAAVEKYCPELCEQPILEGYTNDEKEITRKRMNPLTLRHLLTHTSGTLFSA